MDIPITKLPPGPVPKCPYIDMPARDRPACPCGAQRRYGTHGRSGRCGCYAPKRTTHERLVRL